MKFWLKRRTLIAQTEDEFGRISVDERDGFRFLVFGENVEQSCVKHGEPAWLEYEYSRAMLIGALCHPQPETALFLGLGAGVLTQACLTAIPSIFDAEVIELRPEVGRMAQEHLGFDDQDERLTLRYGDAQELLHSAEQADLIFMDLYDEHGPSQAHIGWAFLQACQAKLSEQGWLILNQWATLDHQPLAAALLRGVFLRHYWELPTKDGNVIVLIPASTEQNLPVAQLRERAREIGQRMGYDLTGLVENIRLPRL